MKITRYAQSCLLIETEGKRILVDPGCLGFEESLVDSKWINIDVILITHKHGDHCEEKTLKKIIERDNAKLYSTKEVAETYPELNFDIVKEGDIIDVMSDEGGVKVEVVKAVHGYIPLLKGGKEIQENVGYIVDDCKRRAYITSDTICFDNDHKCDIIFVPVSNHGLVMGAFEAALFSKETGAEIIVPVHYDNPKFPTEIDKVKEEFDKQGINLKVLGIGESIEI